MPAQPNRTPRVLDAGGCGRAFDPLKTSANFSRCLLGVTSLGSCGCVVGLPALPEPVALAAAGVGLLAGIPHGAADHVIARRLAGNKPMLLVTAVYAGVAALAWGLLQRANPTALMLAVTLSALHFGFGELDVVHRLNAWRPPPWVATAIVVAGSGALLLPLARFGDRLGAVATTVSPALASALGQTPTQAGLMVGWLVAAVVAVVAALRSRHRSVAVDILVIGATGLLAPPLVAFSVWFGGWHAPRHCARLLSVEPGCADLVIKGHASAAVLRLIRLAAVPTVVVWTALAALAWFTVTAPNPTTVIAEILRLVLALTVPHALVVLWLDQSTGRRSQA